MISDTRRSILLAAGAAVSAAPLGALAQGSAGTQSPREGRDYRVINPPQPVDVPAGKIEVLEFFWYGCPHCYSLEPMLKDWVAKLPADVVFQRVHVPFGDKRHQQLFYTLQAMGKADELGDVVFRAIHVDHDRMDTPEKIIGVLSKHGVDPKQFKDTWDSFSVRTRMRRAAQLVDAYRVEGVPAMAVDGKYYTAPSMVGSNAGVLRVLDQLIEIERKAA